MSSMKKNPFATIYCGYDHGKDLGSPYDILYGQFGNPIIGIEISNLALQYCADKDAYIRYHHVLTQLTQTIGEGRIIQKLDVFSKQQYHSDEKGNFLQRKYTEHFEGRRYTQLRTLLFLMEDPQHKIYKYSEAKVKGLREKVEKIFMLLEQFGCNPSWLTQKELDFLIDRIVPPMKISEHIQWDNLRAKDTHLESGKYFIKSISLLDPEKMEVKPEVGPYETMGGSGATADLTVDNLSFLNRIDGYETMIYNQVLFIPPQAALQRELDKKKRKLQGAQKSAPQNLKHAQEIDEVIMAMATDGQLIVNAHFSIIFSAKGQDNMEELSSTLINKLSIKGVTPSTSSYNQLELYRSTFPGNAVELKDYDCAQLTNQAALCFFFKERYPIDEKSSFYLRFTDRQGIPLKVDLSDLPMKQGRINNRNKFVLGPSGSGKSFLMNNIIEQYLNYNYDVVIIDTGDSYSGTNAYKNGRYIQYTEENPITMNPFNIRKEELNIEKMEFLVNLIYLIWQGADGSMTTAQKSILDKVLVSYYTQYYSKDEDELQKKQKEELLLYLEDFGIFEEDLREEIIKETDTPPNYYHILGLPVTATKGQINRRARKLLALNHPDAHLGEKKYDKEKFLLIAEARDTLMDDDERRNYDRMFLTITSDTNGFKEESNESFFRRTPRTGEEWAIAIRHKAIQKIKRIHEDLTVKELSFNSFYEYAIKFLPAYLRNDKRVISEQEFNLTTFNLVLADFYKGGRYEETLNRSADNSLFEEPFIVFEIDNVKDNPKLFPIVTLIIMDTFIQKMRLRKDRRKALIIEEAWKAIASKLMGGYILYLYKTVRKFWGEAIVVTQELDDIIGNAVVKNSIINNSDTFILLDQTKFKDNFDEIASLLSLNEVERNKIFTINNLDNKSHRSRFKEFYIKRGSTGEVYGNEVSTEQYLTYTTEKPEKVALGYYVDAMGSYDAAIQTFVKDLNQSFNGDLGTMVTDINRRKEPINIPA